MRSSSARRSNPPHDLTHVHSDPYASQRAHPYSVDVPVDLAAWHTQAVAPHRPQSAESSRPPNREKPGRSTVVVVAAGLTPSCAFSVRVRRGLGRGVGLRAVGNCASTVGHCVFNSAHRASRSRALGTNICHGSTTRGEHDLVGSARITDHPLKNPRRKLLEEAQERVNRTCPRDMRTSHVPVGEHKILARNRTKYVAAPIEQLAQQFPSPNVDFVCARPRGAGRISFDQLEAMQHDDKDWPPLPLRAEHRMSEFSERKGRELHGSEVARIVLDTWQRN